MEKKLYEAPVIEELDTQFLFSGAEVPVDSMGDSDKDPVVPFE